MNVKTLNIKIDEFVSYTMSFLNNIQVFHWQTQSYSEHQALGEYYESLTLLNDKFVESWQGNQNTRLKFSEGPYSLENYFSKEETKNKILDFKKQVTTMSGYVAELFDRDDLINGVIHLLNNKELSSFIGKEAKKVVEAELSSQTCATRHLDYFNKLL